MNNICVRWTVNSRKTFGLTQYPPLLVLYLSSIIKLPLQNVISRNTKFTRSHLKKSYIKSTTNNSTFLRIKTGSFSPKHSRAVLMQSKGSTVQFL